MQRQPRQGWRPRIQIRTTTPVVAHLRPSPGSFCDPPHSLLPRRQRELLPRCSLFSPQQLIIFPAWIRHGWRLAAGYLYGSLLCHLPSGFAPNGRLTGPCTPRRESPTGSLQQCC
ncbi:unnamed protein product [Urochloa humidicola]